MGTFLARLIEEWGLGAPHVVGPDVGTAAALFLARQRSRPRHEPDHRRRRRALIPSTPPARSRMSIEAPSLDDRPTAGCPNQHRVRRRARGRRRHASPTSTRTTSARMTSGALPSPLALSATTPSRIRCCAASCLRPPRRLRSSPGARTTWCLWSNNEYLADLLPNSEIHPLDAGHFAWEQASDEYRPPHRGVGHRRLPAARWRGDGLSPSNARSCASICYMTYCITGWRGPSRDRASG